MVRPARIYADERRRFAFAARHLCGANRKHDALRGQENNGGIAMLVIGRTVRMVMIGRGIPIMVVVRPTLVMITEAQLHITSQSIGEMNVMMGVIDPVHQRDIRLSGQQDG